MTKQITISVNEKDYQEIRSRYIKGQPVKEYEIEIINQYIKEQDNNTTPGIRKCMKCSCELRPMDFEFCPLCHEF